LHGRKELGTVHQIAFLRHRSGEPTTLSLGGRSWAVTSLEWPKRIAYVVPADEKGESRWLSTQFGLSFKCAVGFMTCSLKMRYSTAGVHSERGDRKKEIQQLREKKSSLNLFLANVSAITITMERLAPSPHIIPPTCSNMAVKGSPLCRIISTKTLVFYILHRYRLFQNKFSICAYAGYPCLLCSRAVREQYWFGSIAGVVQGELILTGERSYAGQ
jgi:hypothetical protein